MKYSQLSDDREKRKESTKHKVGGKGRQHSEQPVKKPVHQNGQVT